LASFRPLMGRRVTGMQKDPRVNPGVLIMPLLACVYDIA
jgi:hypothetical protein